MGKTKPAKSCLHLFLSLLLVFLMHTHAPAWSAKAHRIIASLAWDQLSTEAKSRIKELLGNEAAGRDPLTAVSMWADERAGAADNRKGGVAQKGKPRDERSWHFVLIPLYEATYQGERDCPYSNCLVEKINDFKNVLEYELKDRARRADALKYLVHLMGDLHQPLHCADKNDNGGNNVQVTFFGGRTNLHKVWDSDLIERTGLSEEAYVKKLKGIASPKGGWIDAWANESHLIARNNAYNIPEGKDLGNAYYRANLPVLESQLARAAARLAWLLEGALKTRPSKGA